MLRLFRCQGTKLALITILLVALTPLFLVAAPQVDTRSWKSSDGAYSIEAEYVGAKDGKVSLRKPNGDVIEVPLARLSAEDQAYVAKQAATNKQPSTPAAANSSRTQKQTFNQLLSLSSRLSVASDVVKAYKLFIQDEQIAESDRKAALEQFGLDRVGLHLPKRTI
jgi:hypothetical protein